MSWYGSTLACPWKRVKPATPQERLASLERGLAEFKADYYRELFLGVLWVEDEIKRREALIEQAKEEANAS